MFNKGDIVRVKFKTDKCKKNVEYLGDEFLSKKIQSVNNVCWFYTFKDMDKLIECIEHNPDCNKRNEFCQSV